MEITGFEKKSTGYSPYVESQLRGSSAGYFLSSSEAYWLHEKSDTVFDAVDRISTAFEQIVPILIDKKTGEVITQHPLLDLIENPGFTTSGDRFKYEMMTAYALTGACYPVVNGNVKYEPAGMYSVRGNHVNLVEASDGFIGKVAYTENFNNFDYDREVVPGRKQWVYQHKSKLSETQVIMKQQRKDGVYPLSPLETVYYQAVTKYYGNVHNSGIMKNASRPGGMFSPSGGNLTQQQYEAFKQEVRNNYNGPGNAGRMVISPAPVEYKDFILKPRDMDFLELIENSRNEIYSIYHIPLPLVSSKTMTMSNYAKSVEAFYDMAVIPPTKSVLKQLGYFLLPRYKDGDRYVLSINEKELDALKVRMYERAKDMRAIASYSEDEIRAETGYESLGEDDGSTVWKPSTLIASGEDDDYTDDILKPVDYEEPEEAE